MSDWREELIEKMVDALALTHYVIENERLHAEIEALRAENEKLLLLVGALHYDLEEFVRIFKGYQGMKMEPAQSTLRAARAAMGESDE